MKITNNQLLKLGFLKASPRKYSRDYIVPTNEIAASPIIRIPEEYTFEQVIMAVYNEGLKSGIKKGKKMKTRELKDCLDINYEE